VECEGDLGFSCNGKTDFHICDDCISKIRKQVGKTSEKRRLK
jgi:hypothetical protein